MPIRVITFNVEHGSCHAILSTDNRAVLIDLGWSDSFSPLDWLRGQGVTVIDVLVITHPHADHLKGIHGLVNFPTKIIYRPAYVPDELIRDLDPNLKQAWQIVNTYWTQPIPTTDRFYEVTSPSRANFDLQFFGGCSDTANLNNYSVVTVLNYFGLKFLFPGDLEYAGWMALLTNPAFISAISGTNILVAAHHGRQQGWCVDLFNSITPQLVIISDGAAKDTSYASEYSKRALGAKVKATNATDIKVKNVVSTRDNGHIDINAWIEEQKDPFIGVNRFPWLYTVNVERF
jgi:beta-lactamase superfamily II metal-dependent hydrolase